MKIEISEVRNGLIVKISDMFTDSDPLGESRKHGGEWFALDATDAIARIAGAVKDHYTGAPDLTGPN